MRWSILYENGTSGSLGAANSSLCNGCPIRLTAGGPSRISWSLTNSQASGSRQVVAMTVGGPFELLSTNPSLPAAIGSGDSTQFVLGFRSPSTGGDLVLYLNATVD
jgi:hypothetical protein